MMFYIIIITYSFAVKETCYTNTKNANALFQSINCISSLNNSTRHIESEQQA